MMRCFLRWALRCLTDPFLISDVAWSMLVVCGLSILVRLLSRAFYLAWKQFP